MKPIHICIRHLITRYHKKMAVKKNDGQLKKRAIDGTRTRYKRLSQGMRASAGKRMRGTRAPTSTSWRLVLPSNFCMCMQNAYKP